MAPLIALLCRNCGAPIESSEDMGELRCSACGTTTPLDERLAMNIVAHRARVARGIRLARAIARVRINAPHLPGIARKNAVIFLGLLFAVTTVGLLLPFAMLNVFGDRPVTGLAAIFVAGGIAVYLVVVTASIVLVPMIVVYALLKRHNRRIALLARSHAPDFQAVTTGHCPNCGAWATTLTGDRSEPVHCPYCGADLVPTDEARGAIQAALADMNISAREQAIEEIREAIETISRRPYRSPRIPGLGFEIVAGLAFGSHEGVPMWAYEELVGKRYIHRLEVDYRTNLVGTVWFLPHACAARHREIAAELELDVPTSPTNTYPEIDARMTVLVRGRINLPRLLSNPLFRKVLWNLNGDKSLILDGGGLTVVRSGSAWRFVRTGGFRGFLRDNAPWVAWLARALPTA